MLDACRDLQVYGYTLQGVAGPDRVQSACQVERIEEAVRRPFHPQARQCHGQKTQVEQGVVDQEGGVGGAQKVDERGRTYLNGRCPRTMPSVMPWTRWTSAGIAERRSRSAAGRPASSLPSSPKRTAATSTSRPTTGESPVVSVSKAMNDSSESESPFLSHGCPSRRTDSCRHIIWADRLRSHRIMRDVSAEFPL